MMTLHVILVAAELLLEMECGIASALCVIFKGDRRSKEGHDPVACVLVYRALELMNAVSEDAEEAIHDSMPFFGPQLRREFHRPLHVGEENSYLLTLAFQRASRGEDLLAEVSRWVRARAPPSNFRGLREQLPALAAKLYAARVFKAAGWAAHRRSRGTDRTLNPLLRGFNKPPGANV